MVPEPSEPVHVPIERLTLAVLFDAVAERLATRLLVIFERRPEARAVAFAALDLSSASSLLDTIADAHPALAQVRKLVARAAEQLPRGDTMIATRKDPMTTTTLDLDEVAAHASRICDLLAGASACAKTFPETAVNLVLEARSVAAAVRDALDGALVLEHEKRREEHAQRKQAATGGR